MVISVELADAVRSRRASIEDDLGVQPDVALQAPGCLESEGATHALCDEHVVLAHGMSGVPEVAMAIGSKRPYSRSLLEHLEHLKSSAGVPGPQQFDRLGEGILSEAGSEGLQVGDDGAEVSSSDDPTWSASDIVLHVFRVGARCSRPLGTSTC